MTELARYTVEKLGGLDVDGEPCFLQVGGLEVATTPERLAELHRRHGWLTVWGVEARLLDAARSAPRCTRCSTRDVVLGGLLSPPTGWPRRCAPSRPRPARAADAGRAVPAPGTRSSTSGQTDGRVTGVVTDQGEIPADIVVCCAGIWGPEIARAWSA